MCVCVCVCVGGGGGGGGVCGAQVCNIENISQYESHKSK